jgi:hypothetical protein
MRRFMRNFMPARCMKQAFRKRPIRITLYLLGILVVVFFFLQWLIRNHTRDLIREIIARETRGKIRLDIGKLNFSLYPAARIDLHNTKLEVMDSVGQLPAYTVSCKYLGLQLSNIRSFLFQRTMLVDYFVAEEPEVSIRPFVKKQKREGNALVHVELGNIYMAMQRIAQRMQVRKFGIFNGKLHIAAPRPDDFPVDLTGVDFQVDEFVMGAAENGDTTKTLKVNRLKLRTGRQDITFPNGDYRMKYASLEINSADNSVRIDSFFLSGGYTDTTYGSLQAGFRNLRLVNIDFKTLYEKDLLKVDSVYCQDPDLDLNIDVTASREKRMKKDSARRRGTRFESVDNAQNTRSDPNLTLEKRIALLLGKLDIGYLGLINSDITVNTKNKDKYTPFSSRGNNFEASGIHINSDSTKPIEISNLVFAIKNYRASSADSLYDVLFDSVKYQYDNLVLTNFRLQPNKRNTRNDKKFLTIPEFELRNLSIAELASNRRLVADMLVLRNSRTINYYDPDAMAQKRGQPIRDIVREISKQIDLDKVRIENGYVLNQPYNSKTRKAEAIGIHSEISANEMLVAPSYEFMGYAIGNLRFDSMYIKNEKMVAVMANGSMHGKDQLIEAKSFRMEDFRNKTAVRASHIRIRNYRFDNDLEEVRIDSISWKEADVVYYLPGSRTGAKKEPADHRWSAGYVFSPSTRIEFHQGDSITGRLMLDSFYLNEVTHLNGALIAPRDIVVRGRGLELNLPDVQARASNFRISDGNPSFLQDLEIQYNRDGDSLQGRIPHLGFIPMIDQSIKKKYPVLKSLQVSNPEFFVHTGHTSPRKTDSSRKKPFRIELGQLDLRRASIDMLLRDGKSNLNLQTGSIDISLGALTMGIDGKKFRTGPLEVSSPGLSLNLKDSVRLETFPGRFELAFDRISLGQDGDSAGLNAMLRNISMDNFNVYAQTKKGGKPLELNHVHMGMQNLAVDSADKNHIIRQIKRNPTLFVKNIDLGKRNDKMDIRAYGIGYSNEGQTLSLDSFRMQPVMDKDSFNRMYPYQRTYIQGSTGQVTLRGIDLEMLLADSVLHGHLLTVRKPEFYFYKDKRLPYEWGIIKPLPTVLLQQLPLSLVIDSTRILNGTIQYEEFNDKTGKQAVVPLTNLQATVTGITNKDIRSGDSLFLRATATLLDSVKFSVGFKESYADSLHGFLYVLRIRPFSMPLLNPMLEPLAGAQISSGYLDTMSMRVIGREYIAHGKMKLYYKDLRVNILNNKNQQKKSIGSRLKNFVANLLIDKKNAQKTGSVYAERVREKAFVHYWIRILLGGALTNTGIRTNSKSEKKYLRSVKKHNVPEIPDVDL